MQADQIQCQELKLNGLQCPNPAYVYVEQNGNDVPLCRLHFSLFTEKHKDSPDFKYRTLDPAYQSDVESLHKFITVKPEVKENK